MFLSFLQHLSPIFTDLCSSSVRSHSLNWRPHAGFKLSFLEYPFINVVEPGNTSASGVNVSAITLEPMLHKKLKKIVGSRQA